LDAAFSLLVFYRLRGQVDAIRAGLEPNNYIDPAQLNRLELGRLRLSLEVVRSFQTTLRTHFRLNMLRN
ncbi:MAG: putative nucleotidyltransferase substrate binding domain-containing protein, partial [Trichloromonas sp.]|nr:putative nucleotidyltransferase substrate binding domain-containing protein [Trichloromonas sp.]